MSTTGSNVSNTDLKRKRSEAQSEVYVFLGDMNGQIPYLQNHMFFVRILSTYGQGLLGYCISLDVERGASMLGCL